MTEELLTEFESHIASWKLIPSKGGVYEFSLNGELLFSKKELGRHAEIDEIRKLLKAKVKGMAPDFKL
jgi:selenoprotein W-related protein